MYNKLYEIVYDDREGLHKVQPSLPDRSVYEYYECYEFVINTILNQVCSI